MLLFRILIIKAVQSFTMLKATFSKYSTSNNQNQHNIKNDIAAITIVKMKFVFMGAFQWKHENLVREFFLVEENMKIFSY